jgi:TetR/AcrR family transcriptional regulator
MTARLTRKERREQVVGATLELLADNPIEALTTRQIARAVGITQPGLFRHFRSREAILAEVVTAVRERIADLASRLLEAESDGAGRLRALVTGLFGMVEQSPGIPRLLFHDTADDPATVRPPLEHLASMQESLVAELVREEQRGGGLPAEVDPDGAARLFVAMVQGVLLQWQQGGRPPGLTAQGEALAGFWLAGVTAGQPQVAEPAGDEAPTMDIEPLLALDVRPILDQGVDPLGTILAALDRLPADGALVLEAPFQPRPLLVLLEGRGYRTELSRGEGTWLVEVVGPDAGKVLELRELEVPEPLEQILLASAELAPGEAVLARVPRFPRMLLPHLEKRGLTHCAVDLARGVLLHVRRPA